LLGDLRDLRDDPQAWRSLAIQGLCHPLGARQGSCLHFTDFHPNGTPSLVQATHAGWIDHAAAARWELELQSRPTEADLQLVNALKVPGHVVAVLRPELVADKEFYASPLVRDLTTTAKIDGHVAGWCRMGSDGEVLAFTFHRDWHDAHATARQRNLLRVFMEELHHLWHAGKLKPRAGLQSPQMPRLSPREKQVLDRLLAGDSVKQAAVKLGLSHRTVEGYVKTIHRKFHVTSRGELLSRFLRRKP
jgi:DNA-binding CsgD family transcriptional regulator